MVLTSIDQRVDNARKKDKFLCFLGDVFASEDVGVRGKDASCCTDFCICRKSNELRDNVYS